MLRRFVVTSLFTMSVSSLGCELITDFEKDHPTVDGSGAAGRGDGNNDTSKAGDASQLNPTGGAAGVATTSASTLPSLPNGGAAGSAHLTTTSVTSGGIAGSAPSTSASVANGGVAGANSATSNGGAAGATSTLTTTYGGSAGGGGGGSGAAPQGTTGGAAGTSSGGTIGLGGGVTAGGSGSGGVAGAPGTCSKSGDCAASKPYCLNGTCVECQPSLEECVAGSSPRKCGADGVWGSMSLNFNAKHCGTCGHDCLGGQCSAGQCQAFTIAPSEGAPTGITLASDDYVYFTCPRSQLIRRVHRAGISAGAVETIANGRSNWPMAITFALGNLYFAEANKIYQLKPDGTQAPTLCV